MSVYLPPGYESSTQRYRVVYLLHGYTGNDRGWMNPSYVGLPEMMDHLIERHTIEPMIIVMPNAFNRFGGSFYTNSALSGNWEDFIAHDLVNYTDAALSHDCQGQRPRHCRSLDGRLRGAAHRHGPSRSFRCRLRHEPVLQFLG